MKIQVNTGKMTVIGVTAVGVTSDIPSFSDDPCINFCNAAVRGAMTKQALLKKFETNWLKVNNQGGRGVVMRFSRGYQ